MNWKTEAIDKLRKFDAMRQAIHNIPHEITRLQIDAKSIRSARADATPVKGGNHSREDALLNNLIYQQELQCTLQQAQLWVRVVSNAFGILTQEEKLVLTRFFVYPEKGGIQRLCDELDVEQSSIYRKRDAALHKFTLALYGAEES